MKGRRPAWLIRFGLFLYDHLGGRTILPGTSTIDLRNSVEGKVINGNFAKACEYSDCWIDDSRLVILNVRDAEKRGAEICVRTKFISANRVDGNWESILEDVHSGKTRVVRAKILVNAAGPWVGDIIQNKVRLNSRESVRLVRGCHNVTKPPA